MSEATARGSTTINVQSLDENMKLEEKGPLGLLWHSPVEAPFRLSGFAWYDQERLFRRMPVNDSGKLPQAVDYLANCTAGGQISFRTNSPRLAVSVELVAAADMYHMPATGQCGFDAYIGTPGEHRYIATSRYDHREQSYECILFELPESTMREVTLNFPLYQGVKSVSIGLESASEVLPPTPYASNKKVVLYGTSILQGGCANRPGMAYPNIISRRIPMQFINLGFSGNGRGEPEVAGIISEIQDPALLVLDYEANAVSHELYSQTLPEFIRIYREAHPEVPILVVSKFRYALENFNPEALQRRLRMRQIAIDVVGKYKQQGDHNIHFFDGSDMFGGDDAHECTVDGSHPTDLGFLRMADALTPTFQQLLSRELE
ncbi:SGNH/GDSL hydrolase family protein [Paenibacillus chungangensis]|uniref:SGNH/GDSL hydrolase family protein n=1 Tax=Paenibacillus chungangensis TaxID=696535 RepID=A0ABW3HNM3_9BACL